MWSYSVVVFNNALLLPQKIRIEHFGVSKCQSELQTGRGFQEGKPNSMKKTTGKSETNGF